MSVNQGTSILLAHFDRCFDELAARPLSRPPWNLTGEGHVARRLEGSSSGMPIIIEDSDTPPQIPYNAATRMSDSSKHQSIIGNPKDQTAKEWLVFSYCDYFDPSLFLDRHKGSRLIALAFLPDYSWHYNRNCQPNIRPVFCAPFEYEVRGVGTIGYLFGVRCPAYEVLGNPKDVVHLRVDVRIKATPNPTVPTRQPQFVIETHSAMTFMDIRNTQDCPRGMLWQNPLDHKMWVAGLNRLRRAGVCQAFIESVEKSLSGTRMVEEPIIMTGVYKQQYVVQPEVW